MKPVFDLILGIKSMHEFGIIILDWITIDEITMPMRNINIVTKSKTKSALAANSLLSQEPKSAEEATQRVIRISDVKYEKKTSRKLFLTIALTLIPNSKH
jgi:hypothetical protein